MFKFDKYYLSFFLVFLSVDVSAHVKWFAEYDVNAAPHDFIGILTGPFVIVALLSSMIIFVLSYLDSSRFGEGLKMYFDRKVSQSLTVSRQNFSITAIRYGLVVFFTAVWTIGGVILTPELRYEGNWVISALQIFIIFFLMFKPTTIISGACLLLLWFAGVVQYGFFHLVDYTVFIGIAVFLMLVVSEQPVIRRSAFMILFATLSISLQWASIEKFVYPEWTLPILSEKPYLTMGIDNGIFVIMAGFTELVLAFLLISTRNVSFLFSTIGLAVVLLLAIIDFGKVDAIGHLGLIVCLFVMMVYGPTGLNHRLSNLHRNIAINALLVTALYLATLAVFFGLYYAVRHIWLLMSSSGWLLGVVILVCIAIGMLGVLYRSTGKNPLVGGRLFNWGA